MVILRRSQMLRTSEIHVIHDIMHYVYWYKNGSVEHIYIHAIYHIFIWEIVYIIDSQILNWPSDLTTSRFHLGSHLQESHEIMTVYQWNHGPCSQPIPSSSHFFLLEFSVFLDQTKYDRSDALIGPISFPVSKSLSVLGYLDLICRRDLWIWSQAAHALNGWSYWWGETRQV